MITNNKAAMEVYLGEASQTGSTNASLSGQGSPSFDQREKRPGGYHDDDTEEEQFSAETLVRFLIQEFSADVSEGRASL